MSNHRIGDMVRIIGRVMTGNVGTVVSVDEERGRYLVRIDGSTQNYFASDELEAFST